MDGGRVKARAVPAAALAAWHRRRHGGEGGYTGGGGTGWRRWRGWRHWRNRRRHGWHGWHRRAPADRWWLGHRRRQRARRHRTVTAAGVLLAAAPAAARGGTGGGDRGFPAAGTGGTGGTGARVMGPGPAARLVAADDPVVGARIRLAAWVVAPAPPAAPAAGARIHAVARVARAPATRVLGPGPDRRHGWHRRHGWMGPGSDVVATVAPGLGRLRRRQGRRPR